MARVTRAPGAEDIFVAGPRRAEVQLCVRVRELALLLRVVAPLPAAPPAVPVPAAPAQLHSEARRTVRRSSAPDDRARGWPLAPTAVHTMCIPHAAASSHADLPK